MGQNHKWRSYFRDIVVMACGDGQVERCNFGFVPGNGEDAGFGYPIIDFVAKRIRSRRGEKELNSDVVVEDGKDIEQPAERCDVVSDEQYRMRYRKR
ncbi:hypothetical protein [Nocardia nova]|uniref:hypothetical protein n=1 Tax=Nocardia nova TaxID=37330 RepID=UPI0033CBCB4B